MRHQGPTLVDANPIHGPSRSNYPRGLNNSLGWVWENRILHFSEYYVGIYTGTYSDFHVEVEGLRLQGHPDSAETPHPATSTEWDSAPTQ